MSENEPQDSASPDTTQSVGVATKEPESRVQKKGKAKVSETMTVVSQTLIPILTALAGAGMYAYSQWYVGEVQVKAPRNYDKIEIHVFNDKGNELVFHNDRFQLPPDHYRFEIAIDHYPNIKHDKQVNFRDTVVLTCDVPTDGKKDTAVQEAGHKSTKSARETKAVATAQYAPVRVASVAPAQTTAPTAQPKSVDPAAPRETEAIAVAQLCASERKLRNLPIVEGDARLKPLLSQLSAIQSSLASADNAKTFPAIADFATNVDNLQAQVSAAAPAPGAKVGSIRNLPPFTAVDDLVFGRLDQILGLDAPTKVGPLLPQRVKIVFRLRSLEHQGKNVTAPRNQYSHLDAFLSKSQNGDRSRVFTRTLVEVKDLANQLSITDLPAIPANLPATAGTPVQSKTASVASAKTELAPSPQANAAATAPAPTGVEAINLAKLCAATRNLRTQSIAADDPRLQPLLSQLDVIQSAVSAGNSSTVYPLMTAFGKSEGNLVAQLKTQSAGAAADSQSSSIKELPKLTAIEDTIFNRLNQIFGADAPAKVGNMLIDRVKILVRLRNRESQGQDVSAARLEYTQLNDFLSKQKAFTPAVGNQIQPQVRDLCKQLGIN